MKTARFVFLSLLALPLFAQVPRISDGMLKTAQASSNLAAQIESRGADGWVGYAIPGATTHSVFCNSWESFDSTSRDLHPAGSAPAVFYRVDDGRVTNVRLYSIDCTLEANGRSVTWLEGADARASMSFLRSLIDRDDVSGDGALAALSMHGGSTDILLDVAKNHTRSKVRGKALFWLSQQAGQKVAPALREAIDRDPDSKVKEQAVFGISQLPDDQSIPLLAELAKTHRNPAVRKKAVFWLGQKNNPRALAVIEEILK
ncbi:MAG: lyase domain protein repeat-containing protein [Acidobacteria bacterium]|nr:lyase domain protein repeat-containing protein [Acidobacteriota bacterium]